MEPKLLATSGKLISFPFGRGLAEMCFLVSPNGVFLDDSVGCQYRGHLNSLDPVKGMRTVFVSMRIGHPNFTTLNAFL